jgi:hypothetical protein
MMEKSWMNGKFTNPLENQKDIPAGDSVVRLLTEALCTTLLPVEIMYNCNALNNSYC